MRAMSRIVALVGRPPEDRRWAGRLLKPGSPALLPVAPLRERPIACLGALAGIGPACPIGGRIVGRSPHVPMPPLHLLHAARMGAGLTLIWQVSWLSPCRNPVPRAGRTGRP